MEERRRVGGAENKREREREREINGRIYSWDMTHRVSQNQYKTKPARIKRFR